MSLPCVFQCPEGQGPKSNGQEAREARERQEVSVPRRAGTEVQQNNLLRPLQQRKAFQCPEGQGPKSNRRDRADNVIGD